MILGAEVALLVLGLYVLFRAASRCQTGGFAVWRLRGVRLGGFAVSDLVFCF
jgi:hypothetical protein